MSFRILGLDPTPFMPLYELSNEELTTRGIRKQAVDAHPGFPDRVELRDAEPGESLLLLNYVHQPANTPYRASHAIFVRDGARERYDGIDTVPLSLRIRMLSVRAFNAAGDIIDADVVDGSNLPELIERLFKNSDASYLHAHYAKRGCYAARIERV